MAANGSIDPVIDAAARVSCIGRDLLLSPVRNTELSRVRFAIVLVATRKGHRHSAIGREMKRHPSTIFSAYTQAQRLIDADAPFAHLCRQIEARA